MAQRPEVINLVVWLCRPYRSGAFIPSPAQAALGPMALAGVGNKLGAPFVGGDRYSRISEFLLETAPGSF